MCVKGKRQNVFLFIIHVFNPYKYSMMIIGTTGSQIDWDKVIDQCDQSNGNILRYHPSCFPNSNDFKELDAIWQEAGYFYDDPSIEWTNYFPGTDFAESVVPIFRDIVNAEPWMVWISKINPGQMAPWHFDAHSKINELLELGNPVRYTCYIQEPSNGHVSIVGTDCIYRPAKGSIYRWPSYDAWHAGINGGLTPKYMFNYWGYTL
jgi:hypothetical protein